MTNERNAATTKPPEKSQTGITDLAQENEPWYSDLLDLRVVVFLISVAVIAMTATVLMFSDNQVADLDDGIDPLVGNPTDKPPALNTPNLNTGKTNTSKMSENAGTGTPAFPKPSVVQTNDGSFVLSIGSAVLSGCNSDSTGIKDWTNEGWAQWQLNVRDRRTGFFYCHVTYQAKSESRFAIQLGDRRPVRFTLYPQETDFTEQLIVRLDAPNQPSVRLIADQVESFSGVRVKEIRLVPR